MGLLTWPAATYRRLAPFALGGAYRLRPHAVPAAQVAAMRDAVLDSPYMSLNNLNERFTGTYGFSVVFRLEGLADVETAFSAFAPFLAAVRDPRCNAFFLNPLLVADGAAVAPHIDMSLTSYCPEAGHPRLVSVAYLEVPPGLAGGRLRLYRGDREVAEITPRQGALLTFRGDLRHEVSRVASGAPGIYEARLSLVLEQYRVADHQLDAVPRFLIGSRRPTGPAADPPLAGGAGEGAFGEAVRRALEGPPD